MGKRIKDALDTLDTELQEMVNDGELEPLNVPVLEDAPLKKIRKPRIPNKPNKKTDKPDGVLAMVNRASEIFNNAYQKVMTDRIYDAFSAHVVALSPNPQHPLCWSISVEVQLNAQKVYAMERVISNLREDCEVLALQCAEDLFENGRCYADRFGIRLGK
jgi:hypothetical protein